MAFAVIGRPGNQQEREDGQWKLAEVKRVMALRITVLWKNMEYTVTGCTLRYDRKGCNWYYLLELFNKRTQHSVMVVPMEDVALALGKDSLTED